jgi:hypothetical protein
VATHATRPSAFDRKCLPEKTMFLLNKQEKPAN